MKVYSPTQIGLGSFWGGPLAAIYFLWRNFKTLGKADEARNTLAYGALVVVGILGILPFLPEKFPNIAIPLIYCLSARHVAEKWQLKKQEIIESEEYTFESSWKVFGIGTLTMIIFLAIAMGLLFLLDNLGVISLL